MADDADRTEVKVPGLEPTFRHLDDPDMGWQEVKRIRNADGTTSSVWEKWLAFSPDPQYLSLYARWDPWMVIRRHGHYSPHVIFVYQWRNVVRGPALPGRDPCRAAARCGLRAVRGRARGHRPARGHDGRPAVLGRPTGALRRRP